MVHSPDGKLLAVASSRGVYLYNARSLEEILHISTGRWTYDVAFSTSDGNLLALQMQDATAVYRVEDGSLVWLRELQEDWAEGGISFSPDGRLLASGLHSNVYLWNVRSGTLLNQFETTRAYDHKYNREIPSSVLDLHFSPDGSLLAASHDGPGIDIFAIPSGKTLANFQDAGVWVDITDGVDAQSFAFTPDGKQLVVIQPGYPDELDYFELPSATLAHAIELEDIENLSSLAISPSGDILAVGRSSGFLGGQIDIQIRGADDGALRHVLQGHTGSVTQLSFSPDGERLASGAIDNTIRLWRVVDGALLGVIHEHTDQIYDLDFSPDGGMLAAAMGDRNARLWSIPDAQLIHRLGSTSTFGYWYEGYMPGMYSLDFSPDGKILATGSDRHERVRLWDVADGAPSEQFHWGHIFNLEFTTDGQTLVIEAGEVGRWSSWNVGLRRISDGPELKVEDTPFFEDALAISPAGNLLAAAFCTYDEDNPSSIDLWELNTFGLLNRRTLLRFVGCPEFLVFSPEGEYLAIAYWDYEVSSYLLLMRIVSVSDGSTVKEFILSENQDDGPTGVTFTPDGQILTVSMRLGVIRFWAVSDWSPLFSLKRPEAGFNYSGAPLPYLHSDRIIYSPDGKLLALALSDGSVVLWGVIP